MSSRRVSRRRFLEYTGVAVIGGYTVLQPGLAGASDGPASGDGVAGIVDHVDSPEIFIESPAAGSITAVRTTAASEIWREGLVDLSVFDPGDEILALGDWDDQELVASYVTSLYRSVEGVVQSRTDTQLQTTNGTLELISETQPIEDSDITLIATPIDDISPGDQIFAGGRLNGASGNVVVLRVGVYQVE